MTPRLKWWIGMLAVGLAGVPSLFGLQKGSVDFARDIRPIFNKHCVACHGGVKQIHGLSFIYRAKILVPAKSGKVPVVPGKPEASELIRRITSTDDHVRMPPPGHGGPLSQRQIALLRQWIQEGAPWEEHWAFVPPKSQKLPRVQHPEWCREPVDYFILSRLEKEHLAPSPEADRIEWLRRVTFDLTGLPPTLAEIENFQYDHSSGAYERVVDRLLDSPAFGERWAAVWLDLSRYADSQGYEKDSLRTAWPYRDWLIRAINADMPYDQFTIRQLAGDLLPNATMEDRVATGFHRNTPTNSEGGTDDEQFRVAAVIDRVNTTWQVWQGLTFGCVQCHSHPYDPIEHQDYYRFMAFFNTSRDWDLRDDAPLLDVPLDDRQFSRATALDRQIRTLKAEQLTAGRDLQKDDSQWVYLNPVVAQSTEETRLVVKANSQGVPEVLTEGTVSHNSRFTLEFPVPPGVKELTALRVEVLPRDPAKARYTPELGFIISQLRGQVVTNQSQLKIGEEKVDDAKTSAKKKASGKAKPKPTPVPGEIHFAYALGDELEPFEDPMATLKPDKAGWGALPRLMHPRHLVLVPEAPVVLPEGARLRLVIRQEDAANDMPELVMNRSRYSVSSNTAWTHWIGGKAFGKRREDITKLAKERAAIPGARMPVMREQDPDLRRETAVFVRGNWLDKGKPVTPGIPKLFGSLPPNAPRNRLTLARWLVSKQNPLTARVEVNRLWEQLFGIGLVETLEDFGSSGQRPSHPKLLDYLALRFENELGWSRKRLLRELVLSATYRQDSRATPELKERDPRNRLLAHGPRNRLSAEMIRDNALAVSGLLSRRLYGPSVMPPQPAGIWRAARSNLKWKESRGENKYRRAIYTFWRRSSPYPSLVTFDAPSRLVCSPRRITTNTPLQALVTLNDPVYVEAAIALARRVRAEAGPDPAARIARAYQLATGRRPSEADLRDLLGLYRTSLKEYRASPDRAKELAGSADESATALVANAILNLDTVLTK